MSRETTPSTLSGNEYDVFLVNNIGTSVIICMDLHTVFKCSAHIYVLVMILKYNQKEKWDRPLHYTKYDM